MRILTAATLLSSFAGRLNSTPEPGTVDIAASAEGDEESEPLTIQAMAVKGFAQVSGPLQYVKAKVHFFAAGEPVYEGDYVQLTAEDAKRLIAADRAEEATDEEVAAAQQKATKTK